MTFKLANAFENLTTVWHDMLFGFSFGIPVYKNSKTFILLSFINNQHIMMNCALRIMFLHNTVR